MPKEIEVIHLLAQAWDKFLEVDTLNPKDDQTDFRYHIHRLQDMMYSSLYRKEFKEKMNIKNF